jgi:ribonuclease P protein subunit POP4
MKVTPDIICHELIGTEAEVSKCKNLNCRGISGRIINETRNTFTLLDEDKEKIIAKDSAVFHFRFSDGTTVEVDGKLLSGRPEDRLKKSIRRLW